VVIATPVLAIEKMLEAIAGAVKPDAVITDTGSTKAQVMDWARKHLGDHKGFVGSHPMAGKTESGPMAADAALFEGARWVIVPPVTASERSIDSVTNLATLLGATPMIMDAAEHDAYVAAISHMPMMASTALFTVARASEAWPELSLLAAGGFQGMSRLAGTDPAMAYDIAVTNRENIVHWIGRYIMALEELRRRLVDSEKDDDLYRVIAATELEHIKYSAGKVGREEQTNERIDSATDMMQDFIAGGWLREKLNEAKLEAGRRVKEDDNRIGRRDI
jgi:prephenate dehydrogenase